MNQLAIVIPAYKTTFFERAIASFARQIQKESQTAVGARLIDDWKKSCIYCAIMQ